MDPQHRRSRSQNLSDQSQASNMGSRGHPSPQPQKRTRQNNHRPTNLSREESGRKERLHNTVRIERIKQIERNLKTDFQAISNFTKSKSVQIESLNTKSKPKKKLE